MKSGSLVPRLWSLGMNPKKKRRVQICSHIPRPFQAVEPEIRGQKKDSAGNVASFPGSHAQECKH